MVDDIQQIDDWIAALLLQIDPAQRRAVNRRVAYELRRSQASRIASQRNPDGTAYAPRKSQSKGLRSKKGTIKRRAMFARLRTQRYLKVDSDSDGLSVGFRGRAGMIAIVHQYGDKHTSRTGQQFITPKRELLGLSKQELDSIADAYLRHLAALD